MLHRTQIWMLLFTVATAIAFALFRMMVIENDDVGQMCLAVTPPVWCGVRLVIIKLVYIFDGFGLLSFGMGLVCLFSPNPWLILATLLTGTGGVFIGAAPTLGSNTSLAALGAVLGFIALARCKCFPSSFSC